MNPKEAQRLSASVLDDLENSVKSGQCSIGRALAQAFLAGMRYQNVLTAAEHAEMGWP